MRLRCRAGADMARPFSSVQPGAIAERFGGFSVGIGSDCSQAVRRLEAGMVRPRPVTVSSWPCCRAPQRRGGQAKVGVRRSAR